jgi:hypothetical protein
VSQPRPAPRYRTAYAAFAGSPGATKPRPDSKSITFTNVSTASLAVGPAERAAAKLLTGVAAIIAAASVAAACRTAFSSYIEFSIGWSYSDGEPAGRVVRKEWLGRTVFA